MPSSMVTVIGLPRILKKLETLVPIGPESEALLRVAGEMAREEWLSRMPGHWNRPRNITLTVTPLLARVAAPAFPLRFHEFGTRNPGGGVHIKAGRYMRRARTRARREIIKIVASLKDRIERRWAE